MPVTPDTLVHVTPAFSVRAESLDPLLILNRRHLEHGLRVYIAYYNRECDKPRERS